MRFKKRSGGGSKSLGLSLLLSIICSAWVLWSSSLAQTAAENDCPHLKPDLLKWSSNDTWINNELGVPTEMSDVIIKEGMHVLLDIENPPRLSGIQIMPGGSLTWDLKPIQLNVGHILVMGQMYIGSETCRFDEKTVITLEDETTAPPGGVGEKVIGVLQDGELYMYGKVYSPVWTRVGQTASKGSDKITLMEPVEWQVGDKIVIGATGYDMSEAEEHVIKAVSSDKKTLTLQSTLKYEHFGKAPNENNGFEERAEVGVLDRYIRIEGNMESEKDGFGGHTMVMHGYKTAHFVGVEFTRCGQRGVLARYPIHYHVVTAGTDSLVKDNSIHYNYQRCITLHSVSYLHVLNNLCYDVEGHGIFIEDGYDVGAVIDHNLVMNVKEGSLQPHDVYASSGFFLTNPNNTITNNQVSGAVGNGYWYALPATLIGPSRDMYDPKNPSRTLLGKFESNNVRTVKQNGLFVDLGPDYDNHPVVPGYDPRVNDQDETSAPVAAVFSKLQATKVAQVGVHTRGGYHVIQDAMIGSSFAGVRFANAPGATARQTMTGGLIARTTNNQPTELPQKGTQYESEPARGILINGGTNSFSKVKLEGFSMPNGACIAAMGTERMSADNTLTDIDCGGDQTLLYYNTGDQATDNEKMLTAVQVQGTSTNEIVVNSDFMRASAAKCQKKSDSMLSCQSGTHVQLSVEDLSFSTTKYPASLKASDVHATIYRLNANSNYKLKSKISITGYSDPLSSTDGGKKTMYPLVVPLEDSSDSYGIAFAHQTPSRARVTIDNAKKGTTAIVHMCYKPEASTIKSITVDDSKTLTGAQNEKELSSGDKYWYDQKTGILSFPIVSMRDASTSKDQKTATATTATMVVIEATVTDTEPFDCFSELGQNVGGGSNNGSSTATVAKSLVAFLVVAAMSALVVLF